ncbi:DUF4011 domain-containing anti-phage protein Hhe [Microbulbifer zhoushanensis]|uniref:DUF4011 domain-containing anti-phage protein Hhe n=1 Tax=Microbulbifer zhoushanensis TaxID=2904254 RepID=UPI001F29880B|nr:DUF4011 domain-containing anti-phage protein Hhe [Microbulbifer zhoushanensis]
MTVSSTEDQKALQALENLRTRLLDLTARNRLINFRHTKGGSLRVIDELPDQLVSQLLDGKELRFQAVPEPKERELIDAGYLRWDEETRKLEELRKSPTAEEWAKHLGLSTSYEMPFPGSEETAAPDKHTDDAIQTLFYPYEMEARLKTLLQSAESAIQEMGTNILYLACGFLDWYESNDSDAVRPAPLFLVPVKLRKGTLNRQAGTYEYTLTYSGEDLIPNLSLREKLRQDFGLALPELDETTTPEDYFARVQELIDETQPRWRVRRYISLALLNFSKLLMYLDLDPDRWPEDASLLDHALVSRFLSGLQQSEQERDSEFGFEEEHPIDELANVHDNYPLISEADSSQHSALVDAIDGKNLVIEGPPGTGKSQTITNLIAAAMGQGKKVLFVAEKLAALEVVRSRLDAAGLGDFVLELHSHKTQKRKLLDDISRRLQKHRRFRAPKDIELEIQHYEQLKVALSSYAEKVNKPWQQTGKSLHEIFTAATRYRTELGQDAEAYRPKDFNAASYTALEQRQQLNLTSKYRNVYHAIANQLGEDATLEQHPWCGINNTSLQAFEYPAVQQSLGDWQQSIQDLQQLLADYAAQFGCDMAELAESPEDTRELLTAIDALPELSGDEVLEPLPKLRGELYKATREYFELTSAIQRNFAELSKVVPAELLDDPALADKAHKGGKALGELVVEDVPLHQLRDGLQRMATAEETLGWMEEPLGQVKSALGSGAASWEVNTPDGLVQLKQAIELVAALDSTYSSQRDDLFEEEDLDQLLPALASELKELRAQRAGLEKLYQIEQAPGAEELRKLQCTLQSGGLFRWFSGEWRTARKTVKAFFIHSSSSINIAAAKLEELATFRDRLMQLEQNKKYQHRLRARFEGLDTDDEALIALRKWYKHVRDVYGIGFGPQAAVGDAILAMTSGTMKAIRELARKKVPEQITRIKTDIDWLRTLYKPAARLHKENITLRGANSIYRDLQEKTEAALRDCGSGAADGNLTIKALQDLLQSISTLHSKVQTWQQLDLDQRYFGGAFELAIGREVNAQQSLRRLETTLRLSAQIATAIPSSGVREFIYSNPRAESFDLLAQFQQHGNAALEVYENTKSAFDRLVSLNLKQWTSHFGNAFDGLIAKNDVALRQPEWIDSWLSFIRESELMAASGLEALAKSVIDGELSIDQLDLALKAGVYQALAKAALSLDPELARFSGHSQAALQQQFRECDKKLLDLQREQLAWKIDRVKVPAGQDGRASDRTERVLLEREISKKTRHIPIRQLVRRASGALSALKPCFMMGPMSVSQYLEPGEVSFDLIVMDEASQIRPQDALGAVARGAQLVVVGDPKQLPPTSFFDKLVDDDAEDPTGLEESESILDATLPMFPARRLRWHYRSQHESLIAFSNASFYESNLVLFPSPHKESPQYGIQYQRIKGGCFVGRKNIKEAQAITAAVRRHLLSCANETIGIVAMNAEQKRLIEDSLETLAKEDAHFGEKLAANQAGEEGLFVKNLENVQGDERDVILISMTYGPAEPGARPHQRFGPINSDTGWRRLNVLFTRSRKRMQIFSSLDSDDVVVGSGSRRGVKSLKEFLRYCERGMLVPTEEISGRGPDSDFEVAVMNMLRDEGFECVPQVGVDGFFIDIGVLDPGNPGKYLMGIECDGATYHSAKSARDRDRLRQSILERLGWKIRRIWSTDWFKNPHGELQPIVRELHELKSEPATAPHVEEEKGADVRQLEDEQPGLFDDSLPERSNSSESVQAELVLDGALEEEIDLREALLKLDREMIRADLPDTPEERRLLRPAMLEAFLEFEPTSKSEFLEVIPGYLREGTEPEEGRRFLNAVFALINGYELEELDQV